MEATPSIAFDLEDATPTINKMTHQHLSFRLSTTARADMEAIKHEPVLSNISQKIQNTTSPITNKIKHIKTDEFFDNFDYVFYVCFESPEKENQMINANPEKVEILKYFSPKKTQDVETAKKRIESCSLAGSSNVSSPITQILVKRRLLSSSLGQKEKKTLRNKKDQTAKLSIVSVEAQYKFGNSIRSISKNNKKPTLRALHRADNIFIMDELTTVGRTNHWFREGFLRSGTLENWKRKFNQKRQQSSKDILEAKTIRNKPRSLNYEQKNANFKPIYCYGFRQNNRSRFGVRQYGNWLLQ